LRSSGLPPFFTEQRRFELCAAMARKVRVLSHEFSHTLLWVDPVATVTFFEGKAPVDAFRQQLKAVVAANPWLGARFTLSLEGTPQLALHVPEVVEFDDVFVDSDLGLDAGMSYGDLLSAWQPTMLRSALQSVLRNGPLFRVSISRIREDRFALIVEMNHILGDGCTFYSIYGMMNPGAPVTALTPDRNVEFTKASRHFNGGFDVTFALPFLNVHGIQSGLGALQTFCRRVAWEPTLSEVDSEWVEQQKREHDPSSGVDFVSTSDVLTSALLNSSGVSFGVAPVDLRGKLGSLGKSDAGNYWRPQEFLPEEFQTPAGVRKVLLAAGGGDKLEGHSKRRTTFQQWSRIGVVTNWTSFYRELPLPGCTELRHMPLMRSKQVAQAYFVVFRPTRDKIAVWASVRDDVAMAALKQSPVFAGTLSPRFED